MIRAESSTSVLSSQEKTAHLGDQQQTVVVSDPEPEQEAAPVEADEDLEKRLSDFRDFTKLMADLK